MRSALLFAIVVIAVAVLPLAVVAQEAKAPSRPVLHTESEEWEPETPRPPVVEAEELPPLLRWRARADYVYWWFKDMPLPPVLTTGLTTDDLPGAIGMPGTTILLGGLTVDESNHAGARGALSWWFDPAGILGAEVVGLYMAPRTRTVAEASDGSPGSSVLSQPFFNAVTGQEDISFVALPGYTSGSVVAEVDARLWGAEANGLVNLYQWRGFRIDGLAGFRYLQFHESVELRAESTGMPGLPIIGGASTVGIDRFQVDNNFYGGQFGLRSELRSGRFFVEAGVKLAFGVTCEALDVSGQTTLKFPGLAPQSFTGGLYALSSNIGQRSASSFAVLPEGNVDLGWQPFDHVQFRLGYSFLYLSKVARAGTQVDRRLNPNIIPGSTTFGFPGGPALPTATPIHEADFWLQGFNLGVELVF